MGTGQPSTKASIVVLIIWVCICFTGAKILSPIVGETVVTVLGISAFIMLWWIIPICQKYVEPPIEYQAEVSASIVFSHGEEAFEYLRDNTALKTANFSAGTSFDALVQKSELNSPRGTYSLAIQFRLENGSVRVLPVRGITGVENCARHNRVTGRSPPLEYTFARSEIDLKEGDMVRWFFRGDCYGIRYGEIFCKYDLEYDTINQRMRFDNNQ